MERVFACPSEQQVAREVLIVRVHLDNLITCDGLNNHLACNGTLPEAHVDVVGPQYPPCLEALTNEADGMIWELAFGHASCIAGVAVQV
jgi:hypothetical protein